MMSFLGSKKLKKLISDPDQFFYDLFRKRVESRRVFSIESGTADAPGLDRGLDLQRLASLGVLSFLREVLLSPGGLRDGKDAGSLLVEKNQIRTAFGWVDAIRAIHPMHMSIYTLDGERRVTVHPEALGVCERLFNAFSTSADFIMELSSDGAAGSAVIHFFIADASPAGGVVLRSSEVSKKKYTPQELTQPCVSSAEAAPTLPIDAVYTWVNCSDPAWLSAWQQVFSTRSFDADRYSDNQELRFSLRSVAKYAPWINRIFIVSNCAPPAWLSIEHPKIEWVWHEEIFPDHAVLPTFNSHSIESCLHRIKGLAENFIYFNDDFLLAQPCLPGDFFDEYGRAVTYLESAGMGYPDQTTDDTPDYIVATNNSATLLHDSFHHRPRRLHKHVPYALQRSVLKELEARFSDAFRVTRSAKIRGADDVAVASFLCPHYSNATGRSVTREVKSFTAKPANINKLIGGNSVRYKFVCVNDGGHSASDLQYKRVSQMLFFERYPKAAPWENTGEIDSMIADQ